MRRVTHPCKIGDLNKRPPESWQPLPLQLFRCGHQRHDRIVMIATIPAIPHVGADVVGLPHNRNPFSGLTVDEGVRS